jgi:hypothetical protein
MQAASECNLQRFMLMLMPFISTFSLGLPDKEFEVNSKALERIYEILRKIEKDVTQVNYLL